MRLLVIGRKNGELERASYMAKEAGATVTHATDSEEGMSLLREKGADLVMIDIGLQVPAFITRMRSERFSIDVVACGVQNDPKAAAAAIRAGAKEYVPLPPDAELIAAIISNVTADTHELIYKDPSMGKVIAMVDAVAPSEASILITGQSGTGKEVIARAIHKRSKRASQPLVAINCAAIPDALLESELFGYEKGAFTGAVARRIGKFEEANNGTLLLDEISEMDVRLQAKLLRAIQERRIDRIGGSGSVPINIRILATSNRDLSAAVREGAFREDLFFRLNVVNICLPPLRQRPADIEVLSTFFAQKYTEMNDLSPKKLTESGLAVLKGHDWPGNVRELENMMHRAVLMSGNGDIDADAIVLPDGSQIGGDFVPPAPAQELSGEPIPAKVGQSMDDIEREAILATLRHNQGNRKHAADILGISIRTMRTKLRAYSERGIAIPGKGSDFNSAMGA